MTNKYKVQKKKWRRWSEQAKGVFNSVYSAMITGQQYMTHPKTARVPRWQWRTTAWNAAWIAADAVDSLPPYTEIVDV
jgi:hypothetical protein